MTFTLTDDPERLTGADAVHARTAADVEGPGCSGLHWPLTEPEGLSITPEGAGGGGAPPTSRAARCPRGLQEA